MAGVSCLLARLGLSAADLECGVQQPSSASAREALRRTGAEPTSLHHNCSGKHAGMLAVAAALGVPTDNYSSRSHPVQQQVRAAIEAVLGTAVSEDLCGIVPGRLDHVPSKAG